MPLPVAVILNSQASAPAKGTTREQLEQLFAAEGCEASIRIADGEQVSTAARRALGDGYSVVVAGGGDGTVNGVASVVAGTEAILGILPLGTLNHFAKDLHIPLDVRDAVVTIAAGRAVAVDVGEVNGRIFVNNSSVGLYPALVVERERQRRHGHPKWVALALAIPRIWMKYRWLRVTLEADGVRRETRTPFVFVGNNEYTLEGLDLGARERLDRGVLQVCVAPHMHRIDLLRAIAGALVGRLSHSGTVEAALTTAAVVRTRRLRVLVAVDGEVVPLVAPLRYRVRPRDLRVLVPPEEREGG